MDEAACFKSLRYALYLISSSSPVRSGASKPFILFITASVSLRIRGCRLGLSLFLVLLNQTCVFDFHFVRSRTVVGFQRTSLLFPTTNLALRLLNRKNLKPNTAVQTKCRCVSWSSEITNGKQTHEMKACMKQHQNVISTTFPSLFENMYAVVNCYLLHTYVWGFSPPAVKNMKEGAKLLHIAHMN